MTLSHTPGLGLSALFGLAAVCAAAPDDGLVGHWPLAQDCQDRSENGNHGTNHGVELEPDGARFNGTGAYVDVPASDSLQFATDDLSVALWLHTDERLRDVLGDVLSMYDPATRRGFNLTLLNAVGATTAQSNQRNLFFGTDDGNAEPAWVDCGRPGNSQMIWALTVHDGALYAGTWEPGAGQRGHVYRYAGGTNWTDCGSPDPCNAISALAEFDGTLYAGTSFYSGKGSALPDSPNRNPGGKVYRLEGDGTWADCGKIGEVWTVTGLVEFDGRLYATTCDSYGCPKRTSACFRYDGGTSWTFVGDPGGRLGAFSVHNGKLYGTVFGKHSFARYDGAVGWIPLGTLPGVGQTYSTAIYQGSICLGTWPNGEVFRYNAPDDATSLGRLGEEKEVMGMAVYNGKLYGGTLPLGQVYRYDNADGWTLTGQLDTTPDVTYRRVWSMAVYQGKLFAGTLPAGRVHCLQAGQCVSHDRALAAGWRHLTAVREGATLRLYVDGLRVAESTEADGTALDLSVRVPLRIGSGEHDYFNGRMRDLRLYRRALSEAEVATLSRQAR